MLIIEILFIYTFTAFFQEHKLSVDLFLLLSDSELSEFIPPIGYRIIFRQKWKEVLEKKRENVILIDFLNMIILYILHNIYGLLTSSRMQDCSEGSEVPVAKKRRINTTKEICDTDVKKHLLPSIEETLNESSEGIVILENYKTKQFLTERNRSKVVNIAMRDLSPHTKR